MKVLDFIRANKNWEEELAAAPYCIKATRDGDYVLLKYNQLESDFNEEIVRECRGCIFWIPEGNNEYADVVCYPFDKFGNYGESYAPEIDWNHASVLEKVDGSLIKIWRHNDEWHISTNGTIDARNAPTAVEGVSFYDIVMRALEKNGNPHDFFNSLYSDYTYMFELVSPETRVTIEYPDTALYYLGARNMLHFNEIEHYWLPADDEFNYFIQLPKEYPLTSLEECLDAVNKMTRDEEGFVVCDNQFHRVKIKSPEYLVAAHLRNNGVITVRRVVEMMRANQLDDFCAYAPQYKDFVDRITETYTRIAKALELWYIDVFSAMRREDNKKLHEIISQSVPKAFQDYCYKRFNSKVENAFSYLDKQTVGRLADWIKEYMKDAV